jgi:hypothetical protein
MSIFDSQKYCAALWNWDFLMPCFCGTGIRVADLDGMLDDDRVVQKHGYVERGCHHSLFETTVPIERTIRTGQLRGHYALVRVGFSVIYLWGEPNRFPIYKMQIWREFKDQPNDPIPNARYPSRALALADALDRRGIEVFTEGVQSRRLTT